MQSKKYSCNPTILYKNITRFAPVWGLYTLCLILGIFLIYSNGGTMKEFHFAHNIAQLSQVMAMVNLVYAPVVAQLLFGDLFNSRMCYAMHAMPVRRENLLVTNVLSGILFSVVPTIVMTGLAAVLMRGSVFVNAGMIPMYVFAASNLQFLFFYGLSVLCMMCVGNRLSMGILYGLFNFGAQIAFWLIDTVYTPMLYGVITPTRLAENLTPLTKMLNYPLIETDQFGVIREQYIDNWESAVAHYHLTENWSILLLWAGVGIALFLLAMILYRKRSLECAGDALAFKILEPVFQVLFALVSACFAHSFVSIFIGYMESESQGYLFLAAGLLVGWFACRMLIERSTRVFRLKNWLRLGILSAVLAVSLAMTYFDVFGIATWQPKIEDIQSVNFGGRYSSQIELTEQEDIRRVLQLQQEALEERLTQDGPYVLDLNGNYIYNIDSNSSLIGKDQSEITDCRFVFRTHIEYVLKSGKTVNRMCWNWADGESADAAREFMSRWEECINNNYNNGIDRLSIILENPLGLYVDGVEEEIRFPDKELVEGLIEAIQKDCAEHTMAQNYTLHTGYFQDKNPDELNNRYPTHSLYISIGGYEYGWSVEIFPDSRHSVKYLQDHDLLNYNIIENNLHYN